MDKTIAARVAGHVSSLDVQKDLTKGSLLLVAYVDDMIDEPGELGRAWLRISPELVGKLRTRLDEIFP